MITILSDKLNYKEDSNMNKQKTRISFRLNPEYDKPLIDELSKYSSRKLSMLIRKILRDNLVYRKCEVEDVFAEDTIDNPITNELLASNTDNVNDTNETIEIRQINRKAEINNSNNTNKSKSIKWNIPE